MFDVFATGRALARDTSCEQCWSVVSDHAGWEQWASMIKKSVLVSEGEGEPNGLGARRRFTDENGGSFGEVINIYCPPRLFGYQINEDAPLKDHQGVICFTPTAEGTEIVWFMSANNNGYVDGESARSTMRAYMQSVMDRAAADLARACEARPPSR